MHAARPSSARPRSGSRRKRQSSRPTSASVYRTRPRSASRASSSSSSPRREGGAGGVEWITPEDHLATLSFECVRMEDAGNIPELVQARIRCLALAKLCCGPDGVEVTAAHCRLGQAYLLAGLTAQAVDHSLKALQRLQSAEDAAGDGGAGGAGAPPRPEPVFVPNHAGDAAQAAGVAMEVRLNAHSIIGSALLMEGQDYAASKHHLDRALELSATMHGAQALANCPILASLAEVYLKTGEYAAAIDVLTRVWEIKESTLGGTTHPDMLSTYLELAKAYFLDGEDDSAIDNASQVLAIVRENEHMREVSPEAGDAHYIIACACKRQGRYSDPEAMQHWLSTVRIVEQLEGSLSARVERLNGELATVYLLVEDYASAADRMHAVLEAQKQQSHGSGGGGCGASSATIAKTHKRLAEIYMLANQIPEALEAFQACHHTFRRVYGADDPRTLEVQDHIARLERDAEDAAFLVSFRRKTREQNAPPQPAQPATTTTRPRIAVGAQQQQDEADAAAAAAGDDGDGGDDASGAAKGVEDAGYEDEEFYDDDDDVNGAGGGGGGGGGGGRNTAASAGPRLAHPAVSKLQVQGNRSDGGDPASPASPAPSFSELDNLDFGLEDLVHS